jgi:hypothetical protein
VVVVARLSGRSTQGGRQWPSQHAWNATGSGRRVFGLTAGAIRAAALPPGPKLAVSQIFDGLPVAVLRARKVHRNN